MSALPIVQFVRNRQGEEPFFLGGLKFEIVTVRNAAGVIDVGVYCFNGDVCYDYLAWRKAFNLA